MAKKAAVSNDFKLTAEITVDGRKIEKVLKADGAKKKKARDKANKGLSKEQKEQVDAIYAADNSIYNAKPKTGAASLKFKTLASIKSKGLKDKVVKAVGTIFKAY